MLMSVVAGRLFQLQGVEAATYATRAAQDRLATQVLSTKRGDITDVNGVPLATTVESVAVTADPTLTKSNAGKIARLLAPLLDKPEKELIDNLTMPDSRFVYLARKVYPEVWAKASKRLDEADLYGIFTEPDPIRVYPSGPVASNVIGFVGAEGTGLAGLEYSLEDRLKGRPGKTTYERGAGDRQIPLARNAVRAAVPGKDVRLTLDRDVQWKAQRAIEAQVEATGADSGDIVVMDVKTGRLVALATAPGYDPNRIEDSTESDRVNRPLQDVYEPGSVMKVVTAASLLDAGYVTPDTKIEVPSYLYRGGSRIKDYWSHGTEHLTFAGAIAKSSNIGTVLAVERMPAEEQAEYYAKFGIGESTGIGFPGESAGILAPLSEWADLERATMSFGQGLSVNAVQMAAAVNTVANGGVRVAPSLIEGYVGGDDKLDPLPAPERQRVVSEDAAKQVTTIMEAVAAEDGVAPAGAVPGYRVAGKTGTAQRVDPETGSYSGYTTSFAGFAPAESPRFVAYVALQDPQSSQTGGTSAAPVFADIMEFTLHKYGVPPSTSTAPEVSLDW